MRAAAGLTTSQPGFTTFGPWAITSGNPHQVFQFDATGQLKVARPLLVDWRRSSYTLGTTVGDGTNTSAVQTAQVIIPNRVRLCLLNRTLEVPKVAAPALILFGAGLGSCH